MEVRITEKEDRVLKIISKFLDNCSIGAQALILIELMKVVDMRVFNDDDDLLGKVTYIGISEGCLKLIVIKDKEE